LFTCPTRQWMNGAMPRLLPQSVRFVILVPSDAVLVPPNVTGGSASAVTPSAA
jgi:hypothetical protein